MCKNTRVTYSGSSQNELGLCYNKRQFVNTYFVASVISHSRYCGMSYDMMDIYWTMIIHFAKFMVVIVVGLCSTNRETTLV